MLSGIPKSRRSASLNELPAIVAGYLEEGVIDLAHLHGNEREEYIHSPPVPHRRGTDQGIFHQNQGGRRKGEKSSADYILLDHGKGGTGELFDWSLIRNMDRPYFLAGGLNAENVEQAILQTHPFAVDISSGVETDGVKDPKKITECIRSIRHVRRKIWHSRRTVHTETLMNEIINLEKTVQLL